MKEGCRQYFEKMSEYIDGILDEKRCIEIEKHLEKCPECRNCMESIKQTIKLCKDSSREEASPGFRKRLRAKLRECMEKESG